MWVPHLFRRHCSFILYEILLKWIFNPFQWSFIIVIYLGNFIDRPIFQREEKHVFPLNSHVMAKLFPFENMMFINPMGTQSCCCCCCVAIFLGGHVDPWTLPSMTSPLTSDSGHNILMRNSIPGEMTFTCFLFIRF